MKRFLKFILVLVFMASCSGAANLYIIRKSSVSEKTLTSIVEEKKLLEFIYEDFITIMSLDLTKLLSGIIEETELKEHFRSAYPKERFKDSLRELMKNIAQFLQGKKDSPNYNLNLTEFNKNLSDYLKSRADKENNPSQKLLLIKYSEVVKKYPDYFPMLRLDDIENIEQLKKNLDNLKKPFIISIIILIITTVILLLDIKMLSLAILLTGVVNFIGVQVSRIKIAEFLQKIPEPTRTIISSVAANTTSTIVLVSIILSALGIIILIIKRKNQGGR